MAEVKKLVIVMMCGMDDERSSVAWSIANGGITSGQEVTVFLASAGIDWARKGSTEARPNPLFPPVSHMIENFIESGGTLLACPPCSKVRGCEQEDFLDSVTIVGSAAVHELIKQGAATLSF